MQRRGGMVVTDWGDQGVGCYGILSGCVVRGYYEGGYSGDAA